VINALAFSRLEHRVDTSCIYNKANNVIVNIHLNSHFDLENLMQKHHVI